MNNRITTMAVNENQSLLFLSRYTQIYDPSNQIIPTSILRLIQLFYTIPWKITQNNNDDINTNNQIIYGPEFILDTHSLNCFVQLAYDPKRDNIILYLNPDELPYNIINFILLFQIHSNTSILQSKLSFNGRKIKTGDSPDNTIQWSPWGKRWQCITKISSKLIQSDQTSLHQNIDKINNIISINVAVDILSINHFKMIAYNSINLALNGLQKYESHSKFECTQCIINITKNLSKVSLSIKPQDLPYRLYRVFILFKLMTKWNDVLFQYGWIYYLDQGISFQCNSKKFWDANKLTMTVMKVLENSGKMVPMEQWIDCGIEGDLNFVRFEKMSTKSHIHWKCMTTTAGFYGEYGDGSDLIWGQET